MAQMVDSPMNFLAGEALEIYRRVKLSTSSGTTVEYADEGDFALGVTTQQAGSGAPVSVKDVKDPGSQIMVASGAISAGANVYGADDGKISATVSGIPIGIALEASLADGDQIQVYLNADVGETWS